MIRRPWRRARSPHSSGPDDARRGDLGLPEEDDDRQRWEVNGVGLLFQPRRMPPEPPPAPRTSLPAEELVDRTLVFGAALEAVLLGDASRFDDLFTDDVAFTSPHLAVTSRHDVQSAFGVPEDSLSDVEVTITSLDLLEAKVIAEWLLEATFSRALLFDDDLLIEPTGGRVHLLGVSVAEFRDSRIVSFRHYFDDSQLLDEVPGVPDQLRWMSARPR
jgi:ketosteroid isomerase-like protein